MRKLLRTLLLPLALALPASGQTVDVVFPGYRVHTVEDSTISTHQTYHVALEAALNWTIRNARPTRITLVGPVRVDVTPGAGTDTVFVTLPPDTVYLPAQPDTVVPPDDDPPADDDPVVDPPDDPVTPPDTVAPPPDTTVTPPPVTDPSGAFARIDWDYPDRSALLAAGFIPTTYSPTNGVSEPVRLAQPGPWGGSTALRNTFLPQPRTTQPQVGMRYDFPAPVDEVWLETWIRFSLNWDIGPSFRFPDRPDEETGNTDHKTLFLFSMDPGAADGPWGSTRTRWDVKFGPNYGDCVASGAGSYYEVGHWPPAGPLGGYDWDKYFANRASRCDANRDVWDGQWHQLRVHVRTGPQGRIAVWFDGRPLTDSDVTPGLTNTPASHKLWSVWFGGNRNSGPATEMWFEVGPALFWDTDQGW